jgi:uncharacterized protein (DUF2225 family)
MCSDDWDKPVLCPNCEAYKPLRSFARRTRSGELEERKWCRNCREDTARKTVYLKAVRGVKQLRRSRVHGLGEVYQPRLGRVMLCPNCQFEGMEENLH